MNKNFKSQSGNTAPTARMQRPTQGGVPVQRQAQPQNQAQMQTRNQAQLQRNTQPQRNTQAVSHGQRQNVATAAAKPQKPPVDPIIEAKRAEELRKYRRQLFIFRLKYIVAAVVFAVILALLLFGLISCNFFAGLASGGSENYNYTVELYKADPKEDNEKTVLRHEDVYINGGVYIPLTAMKDYSEYTVAGDTDSISVIFGSTGGAFSDGDCAEFLLDSNCVRVNKNRITLDHPIVYKNKVLYIPYEFIKLYMSGFDCTEEIKGSRAIYRLTPNSEVIGYRLSESAAEYPPIESEYFPDAVPQTQFTVDLSAYEEYMTPDDEKKYLVLANNSNRLPEQYDVGELIDVISTKSDGREVQKLEKYAAMSLEAMLKEATAQGCKNLAVTTGYRSYAAQNDIYNARLEANKLTYGANAEAETLKAVSYPGASDHQTGLGFDLHNMSTANYSFAETEEFKWLTAHCADFGFILRYPKGKEAETGVEYEPWHFRFVGRYHAQNIMRQGLSLEEYLTQNADTLSLE